MARSYYPEHDKLRAIKDKSQAVGEFLEWLRDTKGLTICRRLEAETNGKPPYVWKPGVTTARRDRKPTAGRNPTGFDKFNGDAEDNPDFREWFEGYHPEPTNTEKLLAEFFGIDLKALEEEKRAMLDEIRRPNGG
jgi:hypothetical protein